MFYKKKIKIPNIYEQKIRNYLSSLFYISLNLPARNVQDFLSGESFSIKESNIDLSDSYELLKLGFFKQAMISLRNGLDVGLFSIYWSIKGKETPEYRKWFSSKKDTPYKNKKFWSVILSNNYIKQFNDKYNIKERIKKLELSDYVHTKGIFFSSYGDTQRQIKSQGEFDEFEHWYKYFKEIVEILILLHLLKFPTLNLRYPTEFLISKFGTTDGIPMCGCGFGDEMNIIDDCISKEHKEFILKIVQKDDEFIGVNEWLRNLPSLSKNEIEQKIIKENKIKIECEGGFEIWKNNIKHGGDQRVDSKMMNKLKKWAEKNDLMTVESIIAKRRNKSKSKG